MHQLSSPTDLDSAIDAPVAVVFKHSMACGISHWALVEMRRFMRDHPAVPVYMVDVLGNRALSQHIEAQFNVRHASPQVLVLRNGAVVWSETHDGISCAALARCVALSAAER